MGPFGIIARNRSRRLLRDELRSSGKQGTLETQRSIELAELKCIDRFECGSYLEGLEGAMKLADATLIAVTQDAFVVFDSRLDGPLDPRTPIGRFPRAAVTDVYIDDRSTDAVTDIRLVVSLADGAASREVVFHFGMAGQGGPAAERFRHHAGLTPKGGSQG